MSTIEKSPLINGGRELRLVRYGIVSDAGKAITAVTQAAAVASSFGSSLRFQRLFGSSLAGDRGADSIAATILRAWYRKRSSSGRAADPRESARQRSGPFRESYTARRRRSCLPLLPALRQDLPTCDGASSLRCWAVGRGVAIGGTCTATVVTSDWISRKRIARTICGSYSGVPSRFERNRLHRRSERKNRISMG
jgi:hypothetical protein